jgi:CheY-like chemotaxis protein
MKPPDILFVEDDEDDMLLIRHVCKKAGIDRFNFAGNGKRAVEALEPRLKDRAGSEPPVIFLDLNMPEMNGFDFLRWLRKDNGIHTVPVIILSTSENPSDMQTAYALGANAYLVKSSAIAELGNMISAAYSFWAHYNRVPAI